MPKGLQDYGQSVSSLYTNTSLTDEEGNVLNPVTEEERQYAAHKLLTGTMPEGQRKSMKTFFKVLAND
ncbi:hypothetical protein JMY81_21275 [Brenneria goodwinii]|nr:hypothetical protein [Brenneria goodwinii]MCG8156400.1 hypothetical protein [Brenneria goodwinii]MCG8163325.1 hypothetical protein [Brenneria goodwinii]MCG8167745.1 hypothetical protein [Brenneria goodwinii]MCG8172230.1 hypothetical protein [Brenneria goodwinii]MCG8175199.1 hypothetical protein [Brenneria goodwinii]